jgi:hypothetical protein
VPAPLDPIARLRGVVARVDGHDDRLQACEQVFLGFARQDDTPNLRRTAAHLRNLARADGREPRVPDGLFVSRTFENRTVISGEFGDVAAETITTALHADTDPPGDEDPRPTSQRCADAFVGVCQVALDHLGDTGRPTAHVSVVVDWATLTRNQLGRGDGAFTGPVHPDDVRRLLCDSTVSRVVTGPQGEPLDVGRSRRTVPAAASASSSAPTAPE